MGETTIPDQGIVFDNDRMPRDMKPGQGLLRGGFRLTGGRGRSTNGQNDDSKGKEWDKGMPTGKQGGPLSGGPDGNRGGNGDEPSDSEDDKEDGSGLPTDEEEDVEGMTANHTNTQKKETREGSRTGTSNVPYKGASKIGRAHV